MLNEVKHLVFGTELCLFLGTRIFIAAFILRSPTQFVALLPPFRHEPPKRSGDGFGGRSPRPKGVGSNAEGILSMTSCHLHHFGLQTGAFSVADRFSQLKIMKVPNYSLNKRFSAINARFCAASRSFPSSPLFTSICK